MSDSGREQKYFRGYYISFAATGVLPIDAILEALAAAAKGYHHTEEWTEGGYTERIWNAANEAATALTAANRQIEELRAEILGYSIEKRTADLEIRVQEDASSTQEKELASLRAFIEHVIGNFETLGSRPTEGEGWLGYALIGYEKQLGIRLRAEYNKLHPSSVPKEKESDHWCRQCEDAAGDTQ